MSVFQPNETQDSPVRLPVLVASTIGVWLLFGIVIYFSMCSWEVRGQFGDMFGAVNALFSALAFGVLIYTMWLQRQELQLQRLELELTRKELERSADAQDASRKALERQIELLAESTAMSAFLKAQELWVEKEFKDRRGWILSRFRDKITSWTDAEREDALILCRKMDESANLAAFIGFQRALDYWDDPFGKAWLVLKEIVEAERQKTGWKTKWNAFEKFGQQALEKLAREGRDPQVTQQNG